MANRREFIANLVKAGISLPIVASALSSTASKISAAKSPVCVFSKHLQWLEFKELGEFTRELGFEGIDLTVRQGGHVPPEKVGSLLPEAIEKISRSGVSVPMMATNINDPDDPMTEKILKVASENGIRYYRMDYYHYTGREDIMEQLDKWRPKVEKLAEMNAKYGIHGAYQNHAGSYMGASIWDIWYLLRDLDPQWIGCQFDIRHATAEGGRSWVNDMRLIRDYIHCTVNKDFYWEKDENQQWKIKNVPIGEGMVDFDRYYQFYKSYGLEGPVSVHVEYPVFNTDEEELSMEEKKKQARKVLTKDLTSLQGYMKKAGIN